MAGLKTSIPIYNKPINKHVDWNGDSSTLGRPVSGEYVQKFIKESLLKKFGYVYLTKTNYLIFSDLEDYNKYLETNDENLVILRLELPKTGIGYIYEDKDTGEYFGFSSAEDYLKYLEESDIEIKRKYIILKWDSHYKEINNLNNSIPILTTELLNKRTDNPEKYILIPDETDLNGNTENNTVVSKDGTYLDVIFQTLRALLSEVAKLRNSFKYGINSYNNEYTAMSTIVSEIEDVEEEPLWAVDPEALSLVDDLSISENHNLSGQVTVLTGKLRIPFLSTWKSLEASNNTDNKLIFYFTVNAPNITLCFLDLNENTFNLNLSEYISSVSPLNIMVIVSRKTSKGGNNYIYITSDNYELDEEIVRGYYTYNGTLSTSPNYLDEVLSFQNINLSNLEISKLSVYSKYEDFSNLVIPSKPNDSGYKYEVSHITVRSVKTYDVLSSLAKQLQDSELVYCKGNRRLYIIDNGRIQPIGGNSGGNTDDDGMTQAEMLERLRELGIVTTDSGELELSNILDIIFINDDTKEKFKVTIDAYGNLRTEVVNDDASSLLSNRIKAIQMPDLNVRGFVGNLKGQENSININSDYGLNGDRIKIGSIYAPLSTDTIFGCTHGFIELENTGEDDFRLDGCYLHMCLQHPVKGDIIYHLPLIGTIPGGGTYLVRCKKYADIKDANVFINVDQYDQEWYVDGELLDLTIYENNPMGFALTYEMSDLSNTTLLYTNSGDHLKNFGLSEFADKFPYVYNKCFIDGLYLGKAYVNTAGVGYWASSKIVMPVKSNSIYKNTFELDPAKLAFLALTYNESTRIRWQKDTDYQQLNLNNFYISFPNSEDIYPITNFAPKASFQHKNVCTDKSKMDYDKPNMVTCSFGIDIYKTRCFNWISAGLFNEYVFIKNGNSWIKVASYGETDSSGKRKEFSSEINSAIYNRINGRFPADGTYFTAHKCIIDIVSNNVTSPTTYTYVVGRSDKNGNPDLEHCSEEYTFTLYPTSYTPVIYQITDLQGFNWIEYQVWAAVANKINERILQDQSTKNIIPILINTGDMTQNGTRINEWLDYYNAGKCLFTHLELMNIVGNNDLCGTNPWILGTGDDVGKSNSFYFHLFYCYEINPDIAPIVNGKYVPSLYYFDSEDTRYVMVNSELTYKNCEEYFLLKDNNNTVINIYTGYTLPKTTLNTQVYAAKTFGFTPIYDQLYKITNTSKKLRVACHELPFTVITRSSLILGKEGEFRSFSGSSLVGSHLNQISIEDTKKGIYWFSRLLEFRNQQGNLQGKVDIVIGGHKHTYSCTYPLREYYYYGTNKEMNSLINGPMTMGETLENDTVSFIHPETENNLSKFPLTKREAVEDPTSTYFYPYTSVSLLTGGITYFMCQASGYKLTSNKELPSPDLKFSMIIPYTSLDAKGKDVADDLLKYPMFAIIDDEGVELIRVLNVLNGSHKFSLITYGTLTPTFEYLSTQSENENNHGSWSSNEDYLIKF